MPRDGGLRDDGPHEFADPAQSSRAHFALLRGEQVRLECRRIHALLASTGGANGLNADASLCQAQNAPSERAGKFELACAGFTDLGAG